MRTSTAMHHASRIVSILIVALGIASAATAQSQGIKVHGHWTIDVRNPDGTLAQHHEFENGLIDSGFHIAALLGRLHTTGYRAISSSPLACLWCACQPVRPTLWWMATPTKRSP